MKQRLFDIEQNFSAFINRPTAVLNRGQYKPAPSEDIYQEAEASAAVITTSVATSYSLSPSKRIKIADTGQVHARVFIYVRKQGQICYVSHSAGKITRPINTLSAQGGARPVFEGLPISNTPTVQGSPSFVQLDWKGEMWATGDTDGMIIDVESN